MTEELITFTDNDKIDCVGHYNGKLLFLYESEKSKPFLFLHNIGEDHVKTCHGIVRKLSREASDAADRRQSEYLRYLNRALSEQGGFCKYQKGSNIFCFRNIQISEHDGYRKYLEFILVDGEIADGVWNIKSSKYGIRDVSFIADNPIRTSQSSFYIWKIFPDTADKTIARQIKAYLPNYRINKLRKLNECTAYILLNALKNNDRQMVLEILIGGYIANKKDFNERSCSEGRKWHLNTIPLKKTEDISIESVDRILPSRSSYIEMTIYELQLSILGKKYTCHYYNEEESQNWREIIVFNDKEAYIVRVSGEIRQMIEKACKEFKRKRWDEG